MKSIVKQSYANLEIVIINDGGQDVEDVVNAIVGDIPTTYISHKVSKGRSAAANSGLKAAKGYYLNFLDDDDVFYPDHVETLVHDLPYKLIWIKRLDHEEEMKQSQSHHLVSL